MPRHPLNPSFLPPLTTSNTIHLQVTASFLEIYGEDVYDLLEDSAAADASCRRTSLPIREDAAQGVIVQGLKQVPVASRGEALQVLRKGTTNRCVFLLGEGSCACRMVLLVEG